MDERGLGRGPISDVQALTGGTQNVMLSLSRSGRRYILRTPPSAKRPNSDDTVRREARVLEALAATAVPHPRLIAAELDTAVMGSAFYLMEPINGFVAPAGWPEDFPAEPARVHRIGLAAAETLAALAAVDHEAVGLADLRRPGSFLERQVSRWRWQLDSYSPGSEYVGLPADHVASVAEWLEANRPLSECTGIVHGDYHLGNIMLSARTGEVAAVVDWELVTIGDPLLDLAHFLACWPGTEENTAFAEIMPVAPTNGLATEEEIILHYTEKTGSNVEALPWYKVLAAFRLGAILEGTSVRASRGEVPGHIGRQFHRAARGLFEQAYRQAAECSI
ncbi:phosphotransferase family protein [Rhodococcus pyridinivorans]|uniref:phosphotransferase family protein n=1 Tax=Rhodococcus pyridinivorans TaxID=103816 RepID=UPI001E4F1DC5|nr:phosphotransferase family protein [Rhodococcus pyridinivorans]MCD5422440.1 phosphotransferase family protein [Rhodococcus pyridinivorans]